MEQTSSEKFIAEQIRLAAEPFEFDEPDFGRLLDRIGDARVVLMGESTHGTEEFYRLRAKLSLQLIEQKGFHLIALEADWPDVEAVNSYIHGKRESWDGLHRFPEWMWRNKPFSNFVDELKTWNASELRQKVSIFGLDLYSLHASLHAVMKYLKKYGPEQSKRGLAAHDCLNPWEHDPTAYGLAVWNKQIRPCEQEVFEVLRDLHARLEKRETITPGLFSAIQNAKVVRSAEQYYRIMYEGSVESWNLRDRHMFETIESLLDHHGPDAKIIVWEHNSHIGNAKAIEMGVIGEHNVGQLCRERFGKDAFLLGFLTNTGTVAAASMWGGPMEIKNLKLARADSYEHLLHEAGIKQFLLPLRNQNPDLIRKLAAARLERAVGVLYLPHSERYSHYFSANLTEQFDEICWIDTTYAVEPLEFVTETEEPDTYPFGI